MNDGQETSTRILIVDDEFAHMEALRNTLADRGYSTVGFDGPEAALDELGRSKFDLMLTDLMMPKMDGIELLRKALTIDPEMAVVLMTGQGTIDTAVEAMKAGALDYILKPFKLSVVLPVISRALTLRNLRIRNVALEKSLRRRTTELEEANKELEAFSYSVSHDLRAPLRTVNGFCAIIENKFADQIPAEAKGLLRDVVRSGQRMSALIDDLLRLARLGRAHVSRRSVDLAALAAEIARELIQQNPDRVVDLKIDELPPCNGDPSLLRQVLANLLSNALKYSRTRERSFVHVGCESAPDGNVFFVRDNGVGFDMKYAGKLFGVFQRLHSTSEFEGTGVGLSIVHRIIQRHGGRIWADSTLGQGTIFRFTLPADDRIDKEK